MARKMGNEEKEFNNTVMDNEEYWEQKEAKKRKLFQKRLEKYGPAFKEKF